MQLNPARGRKHGSSTRCSPPSAAGLCSSTPRGDGNTRRPQEGQNSHPYVVYAAQPREGTETPPRGRIGSPSSILGLCSSTPRGDGNWASSHMSRTFRSLRFMQLNPARGRKPTKSLDGIPEVVDRFMQLNPARGRKQRLRGAASPGQRVWFMQLNPARGRKLVLKVFLKSSESTIPVYAAQPREGTETGKDTPHCIRHIHGVYAAQPREGTETVPRSRRGLG